jgi:hypothetical protein
MSMELICIVNKTLLTTLNTFPGLQRLGNIFNWLMKLVKIETDFSDGVLISPHFLCTVKGAQIVHRTQRASRAYLKCLDLLWIVMVTNYSIPQSTWQNNKFWASFRDWRPTEKKSGVNYLKSSINSFDADEEAFNLDEATGEDKFVETHNALVNMYNEIETLSNTEQ